MSEQTPSDFREVFERMNAEHVEALGTATNSMFRAITEGDKEQRLAGAASVLNVLRAAVRLDGLTLENIVRRAEKTGERRYV